MFPVLLQIGGFKLHSFGFFVAMGLAAGILWTYREAKRVGADVARILDLAFWLVIAGLVGARVLFVIVNAKEYAAFMVRQVENHGVVAGMGRGLIEIFALWKGGLVWYGGLLAAFAVALLYLRRRGMPVWATADILSPGVMLGLAIGRLGCLAAGDDHGKVVASAWEAVLRGEDAPWWTLTFTDPASLVPPDLLGKPLYPTQILLSANALAIFGLLLWLRGRKRFEGQLVWAMLLAYSIGRFAIEYFRGDVARGFLLANWVSTSQAISIVVFTLALVMYKRLGHTVRIRRLNPRVEG